MNLENIKVGDKIKFLGEQQRYTVQARNDRYIIAAKPMNALKTYLYTIIDLVKNIRSSCDLILGTPFDLSTNKGAREALTWLKNGEMGLSRRAERNLDLDF